MRTHHQETTGPISPKLPAHGSTIVIVSPFAFLSLTYAMAGSLILALGLLFALGAFVGRVSHASLWRFALSCVLLGLVGAVLSLIVGEIC